MRGEQTNKRYTLGDTPFTFGRNADNTIVFAGGRASRRHAEIRRDGGEYLLSDLGSSNGTVVNGQRLTAPHVLRHGDTFEIGDDAFRFDAPAPAVDKTLIVAPAVLSAPPTEPVSPSASQQPAAPAPLPGAYAGALPNIPPLAAGAPKKRGRSRTLLIVLGLVSLVLLATCVGGALLVTRSVSGILNSPTSAAARTPQPTGTGLAAGAGA